MNVLALAIPLTRLLTCSNLCTSATAICPRFVLNASADWQSLFVGDLRLHLVLFTHRSSFPLADAASHELWAVGFSNVNPFHEKVEHTHVSSVVIHLELAALEPTEEARADVPATLKREPVA